MSFSVFPAWLAYGGAIALAAALWWLQRLRVQPRVVALPAAVLWRLAEGELQPRVLMARFSRLLAYLLSLALVLSLWWAAAGPVVPQAQERDHHLFYLDNSVLLTPGDHWALAQQALLADAARVPAAEREVVLGEAVAVRLLAPGEPLALLEARLRSVTAQVRPSAFSNWVDRLPARQGGEKVQLHYYGARPAAVMRPAPQGSGPNLIWGYEAPAVPRNRGVVSLGVRPAQSGHWDRVDVLVGTAASEGPAPGPAALVWTLNGQSFRPEAAQPISSGAWLLHDMPADGRTLRVALREGDAFPADDSASLVLPSARRVAVAVGPGVPESLTAVVRQDPSLQLVPMAQAQVVVSGPLSPADAGKPTLRLVAADRQSNAFRFTVPNPSGLQAPVDAAALGLAGLDAGALAYRMNRAIGVEVTDGPRREVSLWRELFDEGQGFTRTAAMPVLVARSLHWLASPPPWISQARAGHRLGMEPDARSLRLDLPGQGDPYLAQAGERLVDGQPVAVSLLDEAQTLAAAQAAPPAKAHADESWTLAPLWRRWMTEWLLVLATLLLLLEWHLVQRGRMP